LISACARRPFIKLRSSILNKKVVSFSFILIGSEGSACAEIN
jgi:hypothetical protein